MSGSHADSIILGGAYDGILGVLGPIVAVKALRASGFRPRKSIEVVQWTSEEGDRFTEVCFGRCVPHECLRMDTVRPSCCSVQRLLRAPVRARESIKVVQWTSEEGNRFTEVCFGRCASVNMRAHRVSCSWAGSSTAGQGERAHQSHAVAGLHHTLLTRTLTRWRGCSCAPASWPGEVWRS